MDIITYALCKKYIKESLAGAGALKGDKGDNGKSAYELAVASGFSGTQQQWLTSLKAKPPVVTLGENGNWFFDGIDSNVPYKGVTSYEELENLPELPTKISDLLNDIGYITIADIPTEISAFNNDIGYLTSLDIQDFLTEDEVKALIPTKLSAFTNDVGFLTKHQAVKTLDGESLLGTGNIDISSKIEQIVENKLQDVEPSEGIPTMGRDFTTNVSVGFLEAGTQISSTDNIADILYRILYKQSPNKETVTMIFGGADLIPTSEADLTWLDWREEVADLNPEDLLASGYKHLITTGNLVTEDGQYPVMACSKAVKLIKLTQWSAQGLESIAIDFKTLETENYYIYYLPGPTYDEDTPTKGTVFVFTFGEEE